MYVYILVDKFNMMIRINVCFLIQLVKKQYFKMCVICVIWTQQTFLLLLSCVEDLCPLAKQI